MSADDDEHPVNRRVRVQSSLSARLFAPDSGASAPGGGPGGDPAARRPGPTNRPTGRVWRVPWPDSGHRAAPHPYGRSGGSIVEILTGTPQPVRQQNEVTNAELPTHVPDLLIDAPTTVSAPAPSRQRVVPSVWKTTDVTTSIDVPGTRVGSWMWKARVGRNVGGVSEWSGSGESAQRPPWGSRTRPGVGLLTAVPSPYARSACTSDGRCLLNRCGTATRSAADTNHTQAAAGCCGLALHCGVADDPHILGMLLAPADTLRGQPVAEFVQEPIVTSTRRIVIIGGQRDQCPAVWLVVVDGTGPGAGVVALDDLRGVRPVMRLQRPDSAVQPCRLAHTLERGRSACDVEEFEDVDVVLGNDGRVEAHRSLPAFATGVRAILDRRRIDRNQTAVDREASISRCG